ncbi:MAG: tRNA glutamyl-Q(34) synthetase GluQRS [Parvibaculaceae bacterium]
MSLATFRFAPSPNGRLHLGHAYSALLNEKMARAAGGRFLLRIEDIDTIRCTPELSRAMLMDLAWLGLKWEAPVLRQSEHLGRYREVQQVLRDRGLLYPCFCSRQDIARRVGADARRDPEGQPLYPGTCRHMTAADRARHLAQGDPAAWRIDMAQALAPVGAALTFSEAGSGARVEEIAHPEDWGDVVLARKDIDTSYHIAVVIDDALQGVTHVVRGHDLFHATAIHRLLQHLLALPVPRYHHHTLVNDEAGRKLSKSLGSRSLHDLREGGASAKDVRKALGF